MGIHYVVQFGFDVLGEGNSEEQAVADARFNGAEFDHAARFLSPRGGKSAGVLMTDDGELAHGQVILISAEEYEKYLE